MYKVEHYQTEEGRDVFADWLGSLRDVRAKARILTRIDRMESGNLGDSKAVRESVCEMRIHYGPGYRVYFARVGEVIMLLLCGGDKSTQSADIERAVEFFNDFKRRKP
jgi:probable addiction module killer protein